MQYHTKPFNPKAAITAICIVAATYVSGWLVPLMEIDAAQYANISREMLQSNNYLQLYDIGKDYLDKPPMLFWLSALSMRLFGVNDVAYRLPSFLFSLLALYSCYRLCLIFYKQEIAYLSTLALASCQAMFLINHDVRTDTMLMGWVTLSLWQLAAGYATNKWKHFLFAAIAIAGGMMTKGPIALLIPAFAFGPHLLLRRQWAQLIRWEYLMMLIVIAVLLIPMCIGLYHQFDLHPEKVLYGRSGTSGLRFFFWTQSFGRITGESTWHENDRFFFLYQNMLWSFLPWIVLFTVAIIAEGKNFISRNLVLSADKEYITTAGLLVIYCAFATSRAQLPHYIFVAYPLAAIVTGKWLYAMLYTANYPRMKKFFTIFTTILFALMWVAVVGLLYFTFPSISVIGATIGLLATAAGFVWCMKILNTLPQLLRIAIGSMAGINVLINVFFYPALLHYQPGIAVNKWLHSHAIVPERLYVYEVENGRSMSFYANKTVHTTTNLDTLKPNDYILTSQTVWDTLSKRRYELVYAGESFHVTKLKLSFLNPATRPAKVKRYYLIKRR